jgi:hypothetical protein
MWISRQAVWRWISFKDADPRLATVTIPHSAGPGLRSIRCYRQPSLGELSPPTVAETKTHSARNGCSQQLVTER